MEAAPAAPFIVSQAQFLFELLVIALDAPAQFRQIDQALKGHIRRDGGQPVLGGLGLTLGPFDQQPFLIPRRGPPLVVMGGPYPNRAKREVSAPALASRQEIVCQLAGGKPSASALTLTGWCSLSRRISFGRRPRPDQGRGGSGAVPGGHTEVCGGMPAT